MQMTIQNYITEDTGGYLKFSSPYQKSWLVIYMQSMVAAGIFSMFLFFLLQTVPPETGNSPMTIPQPFFIIFLLLGVLTLIDLLWHLRGIEIAEITAGQITIKHQILGLDISRNLRAQNIDGVLVSKVKNDWTSYNKRGMEFTNFKKGAIAINYGKYPLGGVRTYRYGSILTREDAEQIVKLIHERFPQYRHRGKKSVTTHRTAA